MATRVEPPVGMRLISDPYSQRSGLIPLAIVLTFSWIFLWLWLIVACFVLTRFFPGGLVLLGSVAAYAVCLSLFTRGLLRDAFRDYVFELTETDAVLTVENRLNQRRIIQMVLLKDVKYAEYYPYCDSACIIFYAPYAQMEVPLWPMGKRSQDVVDFLTGRGVPVVNVQTDDEIPD